MKRIVLVALLGICVMLFGQTVFDAINPGLPQEPDLWTGFKRGLGCAIWGDYNGDGYKEVLYMGTTSIADYSNFTKLYKKTGNDTFEEISYSTHSLPDLYCLVGGAEFGDYDNDGDLDLLVSGQTSTGSSMTEVFSNDSGVFTDIDAGLPNVESGSVDWGDYDNDGDLDIVITGHYNNSRLTEIYSNDSGVFTDIDAGLTNVESGSVDWGDYDNDGDLDLLVTGYNGTTNLTKLYQNDNDAFTSITTTLPNIKGRASWGDYDNDGDLDALMTGGLLDIVYRNDDGAFSNIDVNLIGYASESIPVYNASWGDCDNDGDLDILVTGYQYSWHEYTSILINNGSSFTSTYNVYSRQDDYNTGDYAATYDPDCIITSRSGSIQWCDYDNDGDLDIWTNGSHNYGYNGGPLNYPTAKIYKNYSSTANTAPNAPSNLTYTLSGQDVTLSWDQSADAQTPADGLSYNLYVGTTPNTGDKKSAMSNIVASSTPPVAEGYRKVVRIGNAGQNTSYTIKDLPDGTYYWSVQAVDHAFAGSEFATEQTFTVSDFTETDAGLAGVNWSSTAWGDYDNDGDLDLLVTGRASTTYISKIYRNDSGVLTEDIYADEYLTGVGYSSVAWGDYDNDDDLDILITGYVNSTTRISNIYRNDSGIFNNINAGLTAVYNGSVAWGDYDNDGDLDILLTGHTGTAPVSNIYRNDSGIFNNITTGLQNVYMSSVAWGDYDNDGDLDILLTGHTGSGRVSNIYRNDSGTFTDINAGLTAINSGSAAWGDYDNDGDLDMLLTGYLITKVYNNNSGVFTDITAGLTGVTYSSSAWGDYDNDGKLDILVSGYNNSTKISKIYKNTGTGFTDISAGLIGVQNGSVGWSDYDNDGDLDVMLTGDTGASYIAEIYRNNSAVANTIPDYPLNPSSLVNGDEVLLSWDKATDDETPQDGLSYNLYLADTGFIVNPMSDISTGFRRIVSLGNTSQNTSIIIKGLEKGTYYWGVQAIDNSFAGSEYPSTDQVFVIEDFTAISDNMVNVKQGSSSWGDYDGDGDQDILLTGYSNSAPVSKVYENEDGSFTEDTNISLIGVYYSSAAWGDYDGDNDLDILLTGYTGSAAVSKVYRNDDGIFTDISAGLTAVSESSVAWGDYDGDGDLDILLTGNTGTGRVSNIYRNDDGIFTDISAGLTAVSESSVAWGDYDGDDDLDILLTGYTGSIAVSKVYENDDGSFTGDTNISLAGVYKSSVSWGDYDNDDDFDIVLMGYTGSVAISKIYNNNNGVFTDINAGLTGLKSGTVTWGDYDNDGNLDIAMTGMTSSSICISVLYRNDSGSFSDVNAGLRGIYYSTIDWGDYDNDSDLDLLLTGFALNGISHSIIYRNNSYVTLSKNGINVADQEEDNDDNSTPSVIDEMIPYETALFQNYPNPFNPATEIKFSLKNDSIVKLFVCNYNGQMVQELVNGSIKKGFHSVNFDANALSSGLYFYTLEADGKKFVKKMVLTR